VAMKRIGQPEDYRYAALFLCSDLASWVDRRSADRGRREPADVIPRMATREQGTASGASASMRVSEVENR